MITLPTYVVTFAGRDVHLSADTPTALAEIIKARVKSSVEGVYDVLIPLDDNMQVGRHGWIEAPNGVPIGKFRIRKVTR